MTEKKVSRPKKSTTPEGEKFPRKTIPCITGSSDDEKGRSYAGLITSPELAAYRIIGMMQPKNIADEIDAPTMLATLRDQVASMQGGDLAHAEAMLINQASALQAVFVRLSERAMEQAHMPNLEGFMRMALRAQSQCRATLETLATIKNPPIVYAKQANFAAGHQQINNGIPASTQAREIENQQSKLSEVNHELLPDARTSSSECSTLSPTQALDKVDRP
jgi:hypothetical protein